MKKYLLLLVSLSLSLITGAQNTGIETHSPNASAMLDITSANKGLLILRVALTGTNDVATIALAATQTKKY